MHSSPLIRPPVFGGDLRQYPDVRTAPGPYVMNGDFLRLKASSTDASATLTMNGRLLRVDGEIVNFTVSMVITGTGNQTAVVTPLTDGWLIGFIVFVAAGTITDGEVVVSVDVVQASGSGLTPILNLGSGEVTNTRSLGPGGYLINGPATTEVLPTVVTATIANPAAGAELSVTVPAGQVWLLQSFRGQLVTAAVAATREVTLVVDDGTNILNRTTANTTQIISVTRVYDFAAYGNNFAPSTQNNYSVSWPQFLVGAGYRISTVVANIDPGDQWSVGVISYRRYS